MLCQFCKKAVSVKQMNVFTEVLIVMGAEMRVCYREEQERIRLRLCQNAPLG